MKVLVVLGFALVVAGVSLIGDGGLIAIALGVLLLFFAYRRAVKKEEKEAAERSAARRNRARMDSENHTDAEKPAPSVSRSAAGAGKVLIQEIGSD